MAPPPLAPGQAARLGRRRLLLALAATGSVGVCGSALAASSSFELKRLSAKGKHASRFDLLVPKHLGKDDRVRLLVALHGLGESHDPEVGAAAWVERYGLGSSYDRLRAPPVEKTTKRGDWTDDRLREINVALKKKPFTGIIVACPFTPSFKDVPDRAKAIREYGDWIVGDVVPLARKEAPCASTTASDTSIDGCSMGGPYALDIFIAHPEAFGALGTVQGAFGEQRAPKYADAIAAAIDKNGPRAIQLLSSEGDPFKASAKALAAELTKRKIANTVRILPGPHDQPWLREVGSIEMLMFHERR